MDQRQINIVSAQLLQALLQAGDEFVFAQVLDPDFGRDEQLITRHAAFGDSLANGRFNGRSITVCSTGIGAPSAVIALEELVQGGVRQLIRVGSAGSLQPQVGLGDLVVVEGAVRDDGASLAYLPAGYPACADLALQHGLLDAIRRAGHPLHHGLIRSHDAFYRDDEDAVCALWHRRGILAADMESGALLAVGRYRGVRVAAVLCNVVAWQQGVQEGVADYAAAGLESVEARERDERWLKLKARLDLARGPGEVDEAALVARIEADPKDFDARFTLATLLAQREAWGDAFAQLLEIVLRDKADARKTARDKLVEWFPLCPDLKAVMNARRELSMYLN